MKSERDFSQLARSRKTAYSRLVAVKMRENHLPHSRFGIVVSLKVSKLAVERNLVRRRLREILGKHLPALKPGFDAMILASKPCVGADFRTLEEQVLQAFKKIGLFKT